MQNNGQIDEFKHEVNENLKKNLIFSLTDGSIFALANGMIPVGTVLMYFAGNFTDSNMLIGLLNTLYWLMFFTPQVLIAKRVQALKYYKPLGIYMGFGIRMVWLAIGILTFLLAKSHPGIYIVLFYVMVSLAGLFSGLANNVWLVFVARIIPPNNLSGFFSWRASICGMFEIAGAYLSGIILSVCSFPNNYGILFVTSFSLMMISMIFYKKQIEPVNIVKKTIEMDNKSYFRKLRSILLKDRNFMVYLFSTACIALGKMSLAFQVIYAKDKLSINVQDVAFVSTVLFITQTIGYALWGIVVKKWGLKLAGTLSGILFIPAIVLTWWMPNVSVLYIAVSIFSFAQSYRNSNENKLVINLAPNEELLPSYIGLRNTLMGPFFSMSSLIGGVILDISNFTVLSIVSFFLIFIGMILFALRLDVPEV